VLIRNFGWAWQHYYCSPKEYVGLECWFFLQNRIKKLLVPFEEKILKHVCNGTKVWALE